MMLLIVDNMLFFFRVFYFLQNKINPRFKYLVLGSYLFDAIKTFDSIDYNFFFVATELQK